MTDHCGIIEMMMMNGRWKSGGGVRVRVWWLVGGEWMESGWRVPTIRHAIIAMMLALPGSCHGNTRF